MEEVEEMEAREVVQGMDSSEVVVLERKGEQVSWT